MKLPPSLAKGGYWRRRALKWIARLQVWPVVGGLVARGATTVHRITRLRRRNDGRIPPGPAAAAAGWALVGPMVELLWFAVHAPLALLRRVPGLGAPLAAWEAATVRRSGVFDADWYARSRPAARNGDSAAHFVRSGAYRGARPHPLFEPRAYLKRRPLLRLVGVNPLLHYLAFGRADELAPGPLFDASFYLDQEPPLDGRLTPLAHYLDGGWQAGRAAHPLFESAWFLERYPWLDGTGRDPWTHFAEHGVRDTLDPHPCFDTRWYLRMNRDVWEAGVHPLEHYILYGAAEGRDPSPMFDTAVHSALYLDIGARRMNPLVHFVRYGAAMGRTPARTLPPSWDPRSRDETRRRLRPGRAKAVFVLPDGRDTPLARLMLDLLAHFDRERGMECVVILGTDGPLFPRFERHALVLVEEHLAAGRADGAAALRSLDANDLRFAVVASARCTSFVRERDALPVPTLVLVDERLDASARETAEILARHAKRIVFANQALLDAQQNLSALAEGQGRVLPLFPVRADVRGQDRAALRRELTGRGDLPDDALIVLGFGERGDEDAAPDFQRIASRLADTATVPVFPVWVVEDDPDIDPPPADLRSVPAREDFAPLFLAADLVLATAVRETQPSKVLVAMAVGRPVVSYSARGEDRGLIGEGGGRRMMVGDVAGTTSMVQALLADPAALPALGREGQRLVAERHGAGATLAALCALVEADLKVRLPEPRGAAPRPRVVFTTPTWSISGVNTFTRTLIAGLNRRGFDAELLFTAPEEPDAHLPDVPHRFLDRELPGSSTHWSKDRWSRVMRYLVADGPCIFVPGFDYFASAVCPALPDEVGCLGVVHSDDFEHYEHTERLGRYWNALVGVSQRCYERMLEVAPHLRPVAHHIPYGIVLPENRTRALRPVDAPLRIVYTGRIDQVQKNVLALPLLVAELEARAVPFVLTLVGEGAMVEPLREKMAASIAAGRVRLAGRMSPAQVQSELSASDVFLLVSFFEGLPVAMLEAMASGCVPVVSDIESGVPELVRDGVTGFRAPVHDLGAFADHLARLAGDRELLARMSAAAAEHAHAGYGDERMCDDYAAVLHEIWREVTLGLYRRPTSSVPPSGLGPILLPPWLQRDAATFP
ncbi:MAG TPA: glycosyltransferase [Planctomycetota bacterium]|nr:glycosyltransferase [Planctomycetota bacterium]